MLKQFLDCLRSVGENITVQANTYGFNSFGEFLCPNGERVLKTAFETNNTTCLLTAKWKNEDIIKCTNSKMCSKYGSTKQK